MVAPPDIARFPHWIEIMPPPLPSAESCASLANVTGPIVGLAMGINVSVAGSKWTEAGEATVTTTIWPAGAARLPDELTMSEPAAATMDLPVGATRAAPLIV